MVDEANNESLKKRASVADKLDCVVIPLVNEKYHFVMSLALITPSVPFVVIEPDRVKPFWTEELFVS